MTEAQISTVTSPNRHLSIFQQAKKALGERADTAIRILSFGCSTGDEVTTLRMLFPNAQVFGCDVKQSLVEMWERREDRDNFFMSTPAEIKARGPYDLITAMSVLCVHPGVEHEGSRKGLSVRLFDDLIGTIYENIVEEGALVLYNSNYLISGHELARKLVPVRTPRLYQNGFVDLYSRDGERIAVGQLGTPKSGKGYNVAVRYLLKAGGSLSAEDLTDTIFIKRAGSGFFKRVERGSIRIPETEPDALRVFGNPKLLRSAKIATAFSPVIYSDGRGTPAFSTVHTEYDVFGASGAIAKRSIQFSIGDNRTAMGDFWEVLPKASVAWLGALARGE